MSKHVGPMHDKTIEVSWDTLNEIACQATWLLEEYASQLRTNKNDCDEVLFSIDAEFARDARKVLEHVAEVLHPIIDARPEDWHEI